MSLTFTWKEPDRSIVLKGFGQDAEAVDDDDLTDFDVETLEGEDTLNKTEKEAATLFPRLHGRKIDGIAYFGETEIRDAVGEEHYEEKFLKSTQFAHNLLQWYRVSKPFMSVEITPKMVYNLSYHIQAANHYIQNEHGVNARSACLFADYVCYFASLQIQMKMVSNTEVTPFIELAPAGNNTFSVGLGPQHRMYEEMRRKGETRKLITFPRVYHLHVKDAI